MSMPILSRVIGAVVDLVSLGLFFWGLICFIQVLRLYKKGEIFSLQTFTLFRKISRIAFAWAIYTPINSMIMSLVATFHNPVGQRVLSVSINSGDIINIFIVGFILVVTSLMYEGYMLKQEQDLTV